MHISVLTRAVLAIFFASLMVSFGVQNGVLASPLPDLQNHWADREVRPLYYKGIVDGFPDGFYRPEGPITRAQFAKLVVESNQMAAEAKKLEAVRSRFPDVPSGHWARGYIEIAAELGIVTGYPDGSFQPDRPIVRAELVAMVVRTLEWRPDGETPPARTLPYSDWAQLPTWAVPEIRLAYQGGLLDEFVQNAFRPTLTATRAEAGALISRMLSTRSLLYDTTGFVVSTTGRLVTVRAATAQLRLTVRTDAELFRRGDKLQPDALEPLQELGMILDSQGRVSYADVFEREIGGQIVSVDAPNSRITIAGPGRQYVLSVSGVAPVFLNGRAASLAGLAPRDQVFVIQSVFSSKAEFIDAVRATVRGTVEQVLPDQSTVVVRDDAGNRVQLRVASEGVLVLLNGEVSKPTELEPGDEVIVAVDDANGAATYIEAYRGEHQ